MGTGSETRIGFTVIYRWRLHAGRERVFRAAWEEVTKELMARRGALGSRLHKADDGTWVAYAQWANREAWEAPRPLGPVFDSARELMQEAIAEAFEPLLLTPDSDHLVQGSIVTQEKQRT